jgi:lysyl-tRNA synthetase class 2
LASLLRRAELLTAIRQFFGDRGVLEVETPLLSQAAVTDPHLASFRCVGGAGGPAAARYLHTSPEFAMKRLLASGVGPIFQICRVFRDDERGRLHNPEFTLLEWYRPGWDHHALMDEVAALLCAAGYCAGVEKISYGDAFERFGGVDAHRASIDQLRVTAAEHGLAVAGDWGAAATRDDWLDLLMSHLVGPLLGRGVPTFLYDFPASQAALAKVRSGDPPVAERFELFVEGVELANGFHELTDAAEQRGRFEADLVRRARLGLAEVPTDEHLLAALEAGLPPCAGVALGVDRLLMWLMGVTDIAAVLAFPWERA